MNVITSKLEHKGSALYAISDWPGINHGIFDRRFGSLKSNEPDTEEKLRAIMSISGADFAVKMLPKHGTEISFAWKENGDVQPAIECDVLMYYRKNAFASKPVLVITSADCFSLFLVSEDYSIIGAVHCSYRNTGNGIIENVINCILDIFPGISFRVGLLPGICANCFKLGKPEEPHYPSALMTEDGYFDLKGEIINRLSVFPKTIKSIHHLNHCTKESLLFFSDKGGDTERNAAFISYF